MVAVPSGPVALSPSNRPSSVKMIARPDTASPAEVSRTRIVDVSPVAIGVGVVIRIVDEARRPKMRLSGPEGSAELLTAVSAPDGTGLLAAVPADMVPVG